MAMSKGDIAPDFVLSTLDQASQIKLSDYQGKIVYLDFWASWCGACLQSFPALNEIKKTFDGKAFEVIAINLDEDLDEGKRFLEKLNVAFPVLSDPQGVVPEQYQLQAIPMSFLIDKQGKIQMVQVGFDQTDQQKIKNQIQAIIGADQ